MKPLYNLLKGLPFLTAVFSVWILNVCARINNETGEDSVLLIILAVQVYLNWMAILLASLNCVGVKRGKLFSSKTPEFNSDELTKYVYSEMDYEIKQVHNLKRFNHRYSNENYIPPNYLPYYEDSPLFTSENKKVDKSFYNVEKLWYCQKCCLNSREVCHHCPVCNRCVMGRDHHCFLLGTCIGKQNMKHFIVILFYTSVSCLYTHILLCSRMNLYNASWHIIFQHLFPISFTKWFIGQEYIGNLLDILLMNVTVTISLFSLFFSIYYLLNITGICPENDRTWNKPIVTKLRTIYEEGFGSSLVNIIFPVSLLNHLLNENNLISIKKNWFAFKILDRITGSK